MAFVALAGSSETGTSVGSVADCDSPGCKACNEPGRSQSLSLIVAC